MSTGRFVAPGKTRSCPHCRATVLDSATVCPGCHHHLRFGTAQRPQEVATPLRVEGTLRHPPNGGAWEYSVVLSIRNDRGEEIARQIVGVGALHPSETRSFSLTVEVFKPAEVGETKPQAADATAPRNASDPRRAPDQRAPGAAGAPSVPGAPVRPGQAPTPPGIGGARPGVAAVRPGHVPVPLGAEGGRAGVAAVRPGHVPVPLGAEGGRTGVVAVRPGHVPVPLGAEGGRAGATAPWPDPLRPALPARSGTAQPRSGSVFKDPRAPGSVPGVQPKRR